MKMIISLLKTKTFWVGLAMACSGIGELMNGLPANASIWQIVSGAIVIIMRLLTSQPVVGTEGIRKLYAKLTFKNVEQRATMELNESNMVQRWRAAYDEYVKGGGKLDWVAFSGTHVSLLPYDIAVKVRNIQLEFQVAEWMRVGAPAFAQVMTRAQALQAVAEGQAGSFYLPDINEITFDYVNAIYKQKYPDGLPPYIKRIMPTAPQAN